MVEHQVDNNPGVAPKGRIKPLAGRNHQRVAIGKGIYLAMKTNARHPVGTIAAPVLLYVFLQVALNKITQQGTGQGMIVTVRQV